MIQDYEWDAEERMDVIREEIEEYGRYDWYWDEVDAAQSDVVD